VAPAKTVVGYSNVEDLELVDRDVVPGEDRMTVVLVDLDGVLEKGRMRADLVGLNVVPEEDRMTADLAGRGVVLEDDRTTLVLVVVDIPEAAVRKPDDRAVVAAEADHRIHIRVAVAVVTWTTQATPRNLFAP